MKSDKYDKIFEQNKKWVESQNKKDNSFFKDFYKEQKPDFLYIGCSDSRVPANIITGLDIGDLFVHRNIANIVSDNDLNVMSIIQFAVENLKVKHIIVCGHYGCGGIEYSMKDNLSKPLSHWLNNIKDINIENYDELKLIETNEKKLDRLVELNVVKQAENVFKNPFVKKSYKGNGYPTVHGWVYDMKNGKIIDMDLTFDKSK